MNIMTFLIRFILLLPSLSLALESMDDHELGNTTGEGIGAIVDDLSINGVASASNPGFEVVLDLTEDKANQLIFKDFSLYKTGTAFGTADSGGRFGSVNDPVSFGDLSVIDIYSGNVKSLGDTSYTPTTVMRAQLPATDLIQVDRSSDRQVSNAALYATDAQRFDDQLTAITDKFNIDLTIASTFPTSGGLKSPTNFRADLNIEGFSTYGTYADIFATEQGGFSLAGAVGLYIDSVKLSTNAYAEENGTGSAVALTNSSITFNGIDIYTVLGSADQPLTVDTVLDADGNSQIVLEVGYLPASVGNAPKSDIYIESIYFGAQDNPKLQTSSSTYAFQPAVGNTIEIIGMSIQHLKITTKDL